MQKNIVKVLFVSMLLFSCTTAKHFVYLKNIPDSIINKQYNIVACEYKDIKIKQNDILQITIQTIDPQSSSFLLPTLSSSALSPSGGLITQFGYLVDSHGNIELPLVGIVKVENLTTSEAKEIIRNKAKVYFNEPVINVRFANFTITVLGDVNRPGTYPVATEKIGILDALGMAGDMTIFGKRNNVLLIREENGNKLFTRFDLTDVKMFSSPCYYLKQGDVIYVEPNKSKAAVNDQAQVRNITITSTIITSIALIISRINF